VHYCHAELVSASYDHLSLDAEMNSASRGFLILHRCLLGQEINIHKIFLLKIIDWNVWTQFRQP